MNNLFYEKNPNLYLSHNVWATVGAPAVHLVWKRYNLLTLVDVPNTNGKIDLSGITSLLGPVPDSYLIVCCIQSTWDVNSNCNHWNSLPIWCILRSCKQSKQLLHANVSVPLNLNKWCAVLSLLPLDNSEVIGVFCDMLIYCKITKLWEVNYKILSRILATPVVIAAVNKTPAMALCQWCSDRANIDHILLYCSFTDCIHKYVEVALGEIP